MIWAFAAGLAIAAIRLIIGAFLHLIAAEAWINYTRSASLRTPQLLASSG